VEDQLSFRDPHSHQRPPLPPALRRHYLVGEKEVEPFWFFTDSFSFTDFIAVFVVLLFDIVTVGSSARAAAQTALFVAKTDGTHVQVRILATYAPNSDSHFQVWMGIAEVAVPITMPLGRALRQRQGCSPI
jgi:hypothetical protein